MLPTNFVDEEEKAREAGFRNFRSFAGICYYDRKMSLKKCGEILGVSASKIKSSLIKRGFELRQAGRLAGKSVKKKPLDVSIIVRRETPFSSTEEALKTMYDDYFLTAKEIGIVLGLSTSFVCKLLKKHGIKLRKQGTRKIR